MKRAIALLMLLLLPCALGQSVRSVVLFDEYHSNLGIEERFNLLSSTLRSSGYEVTFNYGEMTPELLSDADILVIALPTRGFKDGEKGALLNFLVGGGGLLLVGESKSFSDDYGILYPLNDLGGRFGIHFNEDAVIDEDKNLALREKPVPEIPVISRVVSHPVTLGIKEFFIAYGCSLKVSPPALKLAFASGSAYADENGNGMKDSDEGGEIVVLAASEYGDGRIVAIGDSHLWGGREASSLPYDKDQIEYMDNRKLARNIFFWLSSKPYLRNVANLVDESERLLEVENFVEAKSKLTQSLSILARIGSTRYLPEINQLLEKAEDGVKADNLLMDGERAFGEKRYADARQDFILAKDLYEKIGSPKKEKAQERIDVIDKISESVKKRQEADVLLDKGIAAFNEGDCGDAVGFFREAKSLYEKIKDTEKANMCADYIYKCEKKETGIPLPVFLFFLFAFLCLYRKD